MTWENYQYNNLILASFKAGIKLNLINFILSVKIMNHICFTFSTSEKDVLGDPAMCIQCTTSKIQGVPTGQLTQVCRFKLSKDSNSVLNSENKCVNASSVMMFSQDLNETYNASTPVPTSRYPFFAMPTGSSNPKFSTFPATSTVTPTATPSVMSPSTDTKKGSLGSLANSKNDPSKEAPACQTPLQVYKEQFDSLPPHFKKIVNRKAEKLKEIEPSCYCDKGKKKFNILFYIENNL